MKDIIENHTLSVKASVKEALQKLDILASDAIIFIVNEEEELIGSLTDGDIRRGLLKGLSIESSLNKFLQPNPKYFKVGKFDIIRMKQLRAKNYRIIPLLDKKNKIVDIINFRKQKSYLPIDAVIMAGGKGKRLHPLTLKTPKPLLQIGGQPIVQYNIDMLRSYGIKNQTISVNYLGDQIISNIGDGSSSEVSIKYIKEDQPLGTIGAVSMIKSFKNDYVLIMNSDILTTINYEEMLSHMISEHADMVVATTAYEVKIPYGIVEISNEKIIGLKEKPIYSYYSNAGIYIMKKEVLQFIPKNTSYNATDLIEELINSGHHICHFPILGYWLDVGKPQDFEKAKNDIKHLDLQ